VITNQDLNKAVFTLKSVINRTDSILYIVHDDDDEWQFLNGHTVSPQDIMIVSLQQVINIDATILQILDLAMGYVANRINLNSEWEISRNLE